MDQEELKQATAALPGHPSKCPYTGPNCPFCFMAEDMFNAIENQDEERQGLWANRRLEFLVEVKKRWGLEGGTGVDDMEDKAQLFWTIIKATENRRFLCPFRVPDCPFCVDMPRELPHNDKPSEHAEKWLRRMAKVVENDLPPDEESRREIIMHVCKSIH